MTAKRPAKNVTRAPSERKNPAPEPAVAPLSAELRAAVEAASRTEGQRQAAGGGPVFFDGDAVARVAADAFQAAVQAHAPPPPTIAGLLHALGAAAKTADALEQRELAFALSALLRVAKNVVFTGAPVPPALTAWAETMFPAKPRIVLEPAKKLPKGRG